MKILLVAGDAGHSGATLSMAALAKYLSDMGNGSIVILPQKGTIEDELKKNNTPYYIAESYFWTKGLRQKRTLSNTARFIKHNFYNLLAIRKIQRIIKKEQVDLVHVNTVSSYVGAVAALSCKVPLVWHMREFLEEDHGVTLWNTQKAYSLISRSDCVIAISKSVYQKYARLLHTDRIKMIYNGLDIGRYFISNHKILEGTRDIQITVSGRLTEGKCQLEIIEAAAIVSQYFEAFKVYLVGNKGPEAYYRKLKDCVRKNHLERHVIFAGFTENMEEVWRNTDLCVMCSRAEAFGRVTVEAMLAGAFVIGANTAGTAEIIEDQKSGLLYKQGDPGDLALKIMYVLQHKEWARQIAAVGQKYAREKFSAQRNAEEIVGVYQDVLKERSHKKQQEEK